MKLEKKGDVDVKSNFEQLYNTYYMQVYSFVMTLAKNQHISEEITQKTFFKVMTSNSQYREDSSELTWLCAIAKNLFVDEMRANSRGTTLNTDAPSNISIEQATANKDSAFQIHQIVHDLEEPYKEIFQLRIFGELSFLNIGQLFGKSENWARVTYHRARLKIQERMKML